MPFGCWLRSPRPFPPQQQQQQQQQQQLPPSQETTTAAAARPTWRAATELGPLLVALLLLLLLPPRACRAADLQQQQAEVTTAIVNVTYVDPVTGRWHSEKAELGRFGRARITSVHGLLVHVHNSRNGTYCDYPGEGDPPPSEPWIALLDYGGCSLDARIGTVADANATAVVVYHEHRDDLLFLSLRVKDLVTVYISQEVGEEFASLVDNGTRVHMYISPGSKQPKPNINRTSVLFVSVSFIVLMIISLAWLVFYYVQRFRYIHAKDQLARRLCNAAKKALAKIPVKNIKDAGSEHECCAVCIEAYKSSDIVRTLPCKHVFHKSCVDPWLLEHRTCPMCKLDILKYYGLMFTSSQESILHVDLEEPAVSSSGDRDSDSYSTPTWQRRSPRGETVLVISTSMDDGVSNDDAVVTHLREAVDPNDEDAAACRCSESSLTDSFVTTHNGDNDEDNEREESNDRTNFLSMKEAVNLERLNCPRSSLDSTSEFL